MITNPVLDPRGIITDPRMWASAPGYEFWLVSGNADLVAAYASANDGLDGYGWTATGLGVGEGTGGDFLSSADDDPNRIQLQDNGDVLTSPRIFGSYEHALAAARFLGSFPRTLNVEFYARWIANTFNNTNTFFGFCAPSVTDSTAAGSAGCIGIDASNFILRSDNATDTGAAKDTSWHLFKIQVNSESGLTEWWIDGSSQGTITTEADIWPVSFKACVAAASQDDIHLAWVRVWYGL